MVSSSSGSTDGAAAMWKAEEAVAENTKALRALRELLSYPVLYSRQTRIIGLKWPCGLLLYGPSGTGKTSLIRAVVRECDPHLIVISKRSIEMGRPGASASSHQDDEKPPQKPVKTTTADDDETTAVFPPPLQDYDHDHDLNNKPHSFPPPDHSHDHHATHQTTFSPSSTPGQAMGIQIGHPVPVLQQQMMQSSMPPPPPPPVVIFPQQVQSQQLPPVVTRPSPYIPPVQLQSQPWKTHLFDCMRDPQNAIITLLFPCVTFGQIAEIVDSGSTSCGTSGMLYTLVACCIAMPCIMSCSYRSKMRGRFGLVESPASDWVVHCFCEYCALCQEYRELQMRGIDPSIGWAGNVARQQQQQQQLGMTPPMQQRMMI